MGPPEGRTTYARLLALSRRSSRRASSRPAGIVWLGGLRGLTGCWHARRWATALPAPAAITIAAVADRIRWPDFRWTLIFVFWARLGRQIEQRFWPAFQRGFDAFEGCLRNVAKLHELRQRDNRHGTAIARCRFSDRAQHRVADAGIDRIGCDRELDLAVAGLPPHDLIGAFEGRLSPFDGGGDDIERLALGLAFGDLAFEQRDGNAGLPGARERRADPVLG